MPSRQFSFSRRTLLAGSAATLFARPSVSWGQPPTVDKQADSSDMVPDIARGNQAAVATVHPLATEAAIGTLRDGGNAADAAVAAALMLAVVDGYNSGLGGGCFILARSADAAVSAIDGREMAPAASTAKMFFRDGKPDPQLSKTGSLASGVPGAVAAYYQLSQRLGTGRWADAVARAARAASDGFGISPAMAARLAGVTEDLQRFEAAGKIFLREDGSPLQAGEHLVQTDLARTLWEMREGPESFYHGRFAELTDRWMSRHGGLITKEDFKRYHTVDREPIQSAFREHTVLGFPPPSSGGIHVAQILAMLERFDLSALADENPANFHHVVGEAMRRAFADRAEWLGDPRFAKVPRGLIDEDYLRRRGESIELGATSPSIKAGMPPGADSHWFGKGTTRSESRHTTHISAVDRAGNWIAITSTVNTTMGSKVVIPETGVVMNNEMDDFAIAPGVPNAFGLVGREANAPGPGKRPLSSMSPTIVLRDEEPVLTCGAAGGPRIISAVAQIVLRVIGLKEGVGQAMVAPRIHHQWRPDRLYVERRLPEQIVQQLEDYGHTIEQISAIATAQAITREPGGPFAAVAEPRISGSAAAI